MRTTRVVQVALAFLIALLTVSCGGGGSTSTPVQPPPPPPPTPQFTITTRTLPTGLVGNPYSIQLSTSNGTGNVTWTTSSFMPDGISLSTSGLLSGVSTSVTNTPLVITATDSSSPAKTATVNLTFIAAGLFADLRQAQVGVWYSGGIQFQNATEPVSWSLVSGTLPPGLQMQPYSTGSMQLNFPGTPTQAGTFPLTIRAQDANAKTVQQAISINVIPAALVIRDSYLHIGVLNEPFDHLLTTTGGTPPYKFTLSQGAMPNGLQVNASTGEIFGTPTQTGFYQFNIKVTDITTPSAFTFEKPFTLLVTPASLPPRNDSLADATQIYPGSYIGSISPYTDGSGIVAPDQDYYAVTGNGGDIYRIAVGSQFSLWPSATNAGPQSSSVDPALEILDSTGTRMTTCNDPFADSPPTNAPFAKGAANFTDPCMDHGADTASSLTVQLPPGGSSQTFYIHVFDFKGRARPDFIYTLYVTKQ